MKTTRTDCGAWRRHLLSCAQIVEEFRRWSDASYQQLVPCSGARDIEQMPLGVVHFLEVRIVCDGFDTLLERDHFVVTAP